MTTSASSPLSASLLEALARYDTPTICNAMEVVAPERRLIGYPWHILSAMTVLYLLSLPLGWRSYRGYERAAAAQAVAPADVPPSSPAPPFAPAVSEPDQDDRPARLN